MMQLRFRGLLRAYYNGTNDAFPWCVTTIGGDGLQQEFELRTLESYVAFRWIFDARVRKAADHAGAPRAYVEGIGELWGDLEGNAQIRPLTES